MNILITGAKGFVGKNLIANLKQNTNLTIYEFDIDTESQLLDTYCQKADFVFHLAGVNRPEKVEDFMSGNFGFTSVLLEKLKQYKNKAPILITSSIQAELDNPYGQSKKAGEDLIFRYSKETGAKVMVYRLSNLFGKWCRPNYNSVIATFCHNIANDLPIIISDRNRILELVYIDDLIDEFLLSMQGKEHFDKNFCYVPMTYKISLGEIANLLQSFKEGRKSLSVPDMSNSFAKCLYSTYLSYLPKNEFSYPLKMNIDNRGSFTEIIKTKNRGQFSVNISKSGITKGNHWHNTKCEKFVVVSGHALIQFRKIGTDEIIDYNVSGEKIEVVDIPSGYTHNIINVGESDLITFMWSNECFNPEKPDTFFEVVKK
jgi:UDP-2-acetamido-2,6-beta-L-arabino-hexul-4-ose reductase